MEAEMTFPYNRPLALVQLIGAYARANLMAGLEQRTAFAAQLLGMLINDCMWLGLWMVIFARFGDLNGWTARDMLALWAVGAGGFGLSLAVFGNQALLAHFIVSGRLDAFLAMPKPALLHLLVARMSVTALGDVVFALAVAALFLHLSYMGWVLLIVAMVCNALALLAFNIAWQSITFWMDSAGEGPARMAFDTMIHFCTNPPTLFHGIVKMVLWTALPAGFITWLPVELVLRPDPWRLLAEVAAVTIGLVLATAIFHLGLRRYGSSGLATGPT
jgi:ABC-2 type transport system permease protein